MAYRFFVIPSHDDGSAADELNGFLRAHKVLAVDRRWVEQGASSFWSFCVDYLDSTSTAGNASGRSGTHRNKVDYKEVLSPEEFTIFAKLRDLRKSISQEEAVPVYTVFRTHRGGWSIGSNRVNRGGSWNNDAANCRSSNRNRNDPTNRNNNLGFRMALAPSRSGCETLEGTDCSPVLWYPLQAKSRYAARC